MLHTATLDNYEKVCNFCTIYIVLLAILFVMTISISSAFTYFIGTQKKIILIAILVLIMKY